jgi:gas vesicle protein
MGKGKFAAGALVGAVVGVAAGILTAPKSGKETRADIKAKATNVKNEAVKKGNEVKSKAEEVVEDTRDKAVELKKRTENAVKGAKKGFNQKK